jgi:hypothetical protein
MKQISSAGADGSHVNHSSLMWSEIPDRIRGRWSNINIVRRTGFGVVVFFRENSSRSRKAQQQQQSMTEQ